MQNPQWEDIPEETSGMTYTQQWHKGPRPVTGAASGDERDVYEALGQIIGLEIMDQAVKSFSRLRERSI